MSETLRVGSDTAVVRVSSALTGGALFAYEVTLSPGGGPPHLHRHAAAELIRVEEGEVTCYRGAPGRSVGRRIVGAGDVVAIAGDEEHTLRNESAETARAFVVLAPGGAMERFARAAATAGTDPASIAAAAIENGVEITRPLPGTGTGTDEEAVAC